MSITFAALKTAELAILFPAGAPSNMTASLNRFFVDAMIDLQRAVSQLQGDNVSIYPQCSQFNTPGSALTFINKPEGIIKTVYTIANDDWSTRVDYMATDFQMLEQWAKELKVFVEEPNTETANSLGEQPASDETDSTVGRSRDGRFAINRRRIYLAPWLQSNESIVVLWDGIDRTWADDSTIDEVKWDSTVRTAIRKFVKWAYEEEYGCDSTGTKLIRQGYDNQVADIIHDFDTRDRRPSADASVGNPLPSQDELDAEELP